jgi:predicted TIM-barrel fold metal-dependent hydrolase
VGAPRAQHARLRDQLATGPAASPARRLRVGRCDHLPEHWSFPIHFNDAEVRLAMCRAFNRMQSEIFREYRDRLIPVAIIPMHTPTEALGELEYAVNTLGFKAIVMPAYVRRSIEAAARKNPELARHALWYDNFCIDSAYDYDPVWAKCLELKLSPTFHSPTSGLNTRATVSNFVYNHIGHFAAGGEVICKALFLVD